MKTSALIKSIALDGLKLTLTSDSNIKATGSSETIKKWASAIRENKPELVTFLALQVSDRQTARISGGHNLAIWPEIEPQRAVSDEQCRVRTPPNPHTKIWRSGALTRTARSIPPESASPNPAKSPQDTEGRNHWWDRPIDGWPDRVTIRSVLTGEERVIDLSREPFGKA